MTLDRSMASSNPSVRSNPSLGNGRNGRGAENPHPPNRSAEAPTKKPYAAWAAMMEAAPDEEAGLALPEGERILEVTLISAQGLKPPSGLRRRLLQAYAVAWVDAARRLQTRPDRAGGVDPEWHERLLFRVHEAALADDSRAAVTVEIYASSPAAGTSGDSWSAPPGSCSATTASCPGPSGPRRCSPSVCAAPPAASTASLTWRPVSSPRRRPRQLPTLSAHPPPSPSAASPRRPSQQAACSASSTARFRRPHPLRRFLRPRSSRLQPSRTRSALTSWTLR